MSPMRGHSYRFFENDRILSFSFVGADLFSLVCKNNNDIRFDPQKVIGIIREYKF